MLRLLLALSLHTFASGCAWYTYAPVSVRVVDVESGRPLPDAVVRVYYDYMFILNPPDAAQVTTDLTGNATIDVADFRAGIIWWRVDHQHYAALQNDASEGRRIPQAFDANGGKREAVVRLLCEPVPQVIIEVPVGYRGPVALTLTTLPDAQPPYAREFFAPLTESATAETQVPDELFHGWYPAQMAWNHRPLEIEARYRNGVRLPRPSVEREAVALRSVWGVENGKKRLYLVGTHAEAKALLDRIAPAIPDGAGARTLDEQAFASFFR